jgi:hypothetical protein
VAAVAAPRRRRRRRCRSARRATSTALPRLGGRLWRCAASQADAALAPPLSVPVAGPCASPSCGASVPAWRRVRKLRCADYVAIRPSVVSSTGGGGGAAAASSGCGRGFFPAQSACLSACLPHLGVVRIRAGVVVAQSSPYVVPVGRWAWRLPPGVDGLIARLTQRRAHAHGWRLGARAPRLAAAGSSRATRRRARVETVRARTCRQASRRSAHDRAAQATGHPRHRDHYVVSDRVRSGCLPTCSIGL